LTPQKSFWSFISFFLKAGVKPVKPVKPVFRYFSVKDVKEVRGALNEHHRSA
jgi:hypothetical protein